jgi:glucose/arabinose dehydrogenase
MTAVPIPLPVPVAALVLAGIVAATLAFGPGRADAAPGAAATPGSGSGGVELTEIARLATPVQTVSAPGKRNRKLLFVVEQAGRVMVIRGGKVLRRPFLDISGRVRSLASGGGSEEGLLSIAFAPDYAKSRRLYAYYTDRDSNIRVAQFRRAKDKPLQAKPRSERRVIVIRHPGANNHNGGRLHLDKGGMWFGTGDGGGACDPSGNAQNRGSLLGKLIRIRPKRKGGYRTPKSNPFVGHAGRGEIYAVGLRNPFRFSFAGGAIAIGDVGQSRREEVNYVRRSALRGANFGWNAFEGTLAGPCGSGSAPAPPAHIAPIHEYRHSGPGQTGCSITGGLVVRDPRLRTLRDRYLYADFCAGQLRSLVPSPGGASGERALGPRVSAPVSFDEGRGKRVYVTSLTGPILRLDPAGRG